MLMAHKMYNCNVMPENNRKKQLPFFVILSLIILPLILGAVYLVVHEYNHQTTVALERRESVANLAALLIHEKFDGVIDVGLTLASHVGFYQYIEKGNWGDAIKQIEGVLQMDPILDNVILLDKDGILKATMTPAPEMLGKSFAYRDYYQGVSKEWKPYVSAAFKRAVEPKYNVVAVAIPIKLHDQKVIGILLLTIKLDTVLNWTHELNVDSTGFAYVVDKKGQLVSHPHMNPDADLTDYSSVVTVQKLLRGEHGVEVLFNSIDNEERVTAYTPVKDYWFGVAVVQPTRTAFAERTSQIVEITIILVLVILITGIFSYRVLKDRDLMKAQRDRERVMLDSIGDGIVAIDRDWQITLWNKAASAITGWGEEEALGKPFRSIVRFIRSRDRKEDVAFIEDAIVMKRTSFMEDGVLLIRKDGSEILVGDSAAPIINNGETTNGAIVVFRDASKENESTHLRSDFMYASHQLRTPVTEALWNLETAMDEQDPDKKKEDMRIAHQSILSIKNLSEDLVAVSEIDQNNIVVKSEPVKFIDVLTEAQSKVEALAKVRNVTISIAPVSPLMAISTDKKLLIRALFEIIENAITYGPHDATVQVATTLKEKELLIEVIDNGFGIPEEDQVTLFTKFFRGSNRGKENAGDGLGLYIAKAYVALLGGKIWFESEEGKGTTFFVSLPIA